MTSDAVARLNAALEGRYASERELGEGGMATVYLAKDLKHERKVALKVLKPELAAVVGAERFLAEIKTTANLTHPHILPLFDSGEADGFLFYVMPHIEGESLRERIDREKQLGVDDSLAITQKVAVALDYAHQNGIVHRDIKPGNILLSAQGEPLIADFGIALAVAQAGGGRITETGLSLGTPHYMSPEQATGDRDVDPRSDVYALGCVLYEMLAGQPPFSASTAQAVLVKILTADAPSITSERRTVPPNVGAALAQALEKLPADRFTSAAEFGAALGDESFTYKARARTSVAASTSEPVAAQAPATVPGPWNRLTVAFATTAVLLAGLAAWGWLKPSLSLEPGVPTQAQVTGLDIATGGAGGVTGASLALSPDGRWIVAVGAEGTTRHLYIRPADDTEWRQIPNTEGARNPTFSPEGQWVAFTAGGTISQVPITGGPVFPIAAAGIAPHWGLNDTIVYADQVTRALYRVGSSGGEAELLLASDTVVVRFPHLLPNGKAVVFSTPAAGNPL
ncbi:MAG: protein kinase, partial [Longimicrobiales bacterium]